MASGAYGEACRNFSLKRESKRAASARISFPGLPAVRQAFFQAQKGWRKGLERGHAVVAHCSLPKALATWDDDITSPMLRSSRMPMTSRCLSRAICTQGPLGSMTKPSQVLTSASRVFFQLRGYPKLAAGGTGKWQGGRSRTSEATRQSRQQRQSPIDLREDSIGEPQKDGSHAAPVKLGTCHAIRAYSINPPFVP